MSLSQSFLVQLQLTSVFNSLKYRSGSLLFILLLLETITVSMASEDLLFTDSDNSDSELEGNH